MAYSISLVCFFFFLTFTYTEAQMVPALFVFGDSLVDVGNNNHLKLSLAKADFRHNGVDFPGQKATGRFSNGKNAADFLAEKLGLPTSPPYLSLVSASNKSNAFLSGVSFASGGAKIMDGTDDQFKQSLSLNKQIQYYSTVHGDLVQQLGTNGAQNLLSKSLFAVVIGSNDILGYLRNGSTLRLKNTPQQLIDSMVLTLRGQLKRIYDLSARKFVMICAPAIGCCPSQRNQNKTGECNEETNYWSRKYNEGVKSLLQELKSELKDINYSFFDTYSVVLNVLQKPSVYGFTELKAACCGLGNLNAKVACLPISKFCSNRRNHFFWDLYHPTEEVSRIFTDTIFAGSQPYAYPINVKQLANL